MRRKESLDRRPPYRVRRVLHDSKKLRTSHKRREKQRTITRKIWWARRTPPSIRSWAPSLIPEPVRLRATKKRLPVFSIWNFLRPKPTGFHLVHLKFCCFSGLCHSDINNIRHTCVVNAISLGITPNIVKKWTGHSYYKRP